jgi:hypothetical protein
MVIVQWPENKHTIKDGQLAVFLLPAIFKFADGRDNMKIIKFVTGKNRRIKKRGHHERKNTKI